MTPSDQGGDPRKGGFSFGNLGAEFEREFTNVVRMLCDNERSKVIPPENVVHYSHGRRWLERTPAGEMVQSQFEEHSHLFALQLEDIRAHNIQVLPDHVAAVVKEMTNQFLQTMYSKLNEATEAVGNVVHAKQFGSPALAFLEMLKRIEFGVDRQGNPTRPQLRLGKEALETLKRDFEKGGKELEDRIAEITRQKEQDAIERNRARLSRFRKAS